MIENVSRNAGVSPATDPTQKTAGTKTLCHTPFGDVMVDELSSPSLAGIFPAGRLDAKSASAASQPAVATPMEPAAAAAAAMAQAAAAATVPAAAAADAPAQDSAPTAESVFGPNPWITNPTGMGPDGTLYSYNPLYFATAAPAAQVAQMVGGKVVASDQIASLGGFAQQEPNQMVQLANGTLINAGLFAAIYTHGYPQSYVDMLVQNEIQGT
jgi:hypothetical protein